VDGSKHGYTLKIKQLTDQIYKYIYPCFLSLDRTSVVDKCSVPIDANDSYVSSYGFLDSRASQPRIFVLVGEDSGLEWNRHS